MNDFRGIKGIRVKIFEVTFNKEINDFIKEHDGNIIDIQFQSTTSGTYTKSDVMIIYQS